MTTPAEPVASNAQPSGVSIPNEMLFQALVEHSSDVLALVSKEGHFIYVSPAVQKVLGFTQEEMLAYTPLDLFPPEYMADLELFEPVTRSPGATVTIIHRYLHKDGSIRWLESTITNQLADPTLQAYVATFHDITERRKADEDRLQLAAIVESSDDAIIGKTLEGIITSWNAAAGRIYGYRAEEVVGQSILLLFPQDRKDELTDILERIKRGERIDPYETTRVRKDGTVFPVSVTISPIRDGNGQLIGASAIARDISRQKQLEAEARQARNELEVILQSVADGVSVQDAQGRLIYINDAGARLSGFPSATEAFPTPEIRSNQAIRLQPYTLKDEHGNPLPVELLPGNRALRGEPDPQAIIQYEDMASRTRRWSLVKSRPIFDERGQVELAVNIFSDITEAYLAEKRKDEFISMVSHELKTPVTSIKGFTQLLHRRFQRRDDEESLGFLARMDAQLNKLTTLINDLLDISRMQSGQIIYRENRFDLDELVREVQGNIQTTTQTHKIVIEGTTGGYVFGDRDRIGQVLINLLTNAIKYSADANRVMIRLAKDQDKAIVSVQDFGIGIAKAHHDKIFERFYQVTEPMEKTFPGLGIGLYISNEIIRRHHGGMWVESAKGKGSTFSFSLPLSQEL
jgi:PAS domain S-box-containing protein